MKLTDHGDLDPAVEKRLEIEDAVREKYRADELAWQTRLVRDALRARRPSMAWQVSDYLWSVLSQTHTATETGNL